MKAKKLLSLLVVVSALSLVGCNGGDSSNSVADSLPISVDSSNGEESDDSVDTTPVYGQDEKYAISQVTTVGESYTVRGIVDAVTTKGVIITDGVSSIYINFGNTPEYAIGDYLEVTGKAGTFNGAIQFNPAAKNDADKATVTKVTESHSITAAAPVSLTAAIADSWATASSFGVDDIKEYSWTATAGKSGNYTTLNLEGSDTTIEPSYVPKSFTFEEGKTYNITAYFGGFAAGYGDYAAVYVTSSEETGDTPNPDPDPEPGKVVDISSITSPGDYTIEGLIVAENERSAVVYDGTGAIQVFAYEAITEKYDVGDAVKITGNVDESGSGKDHGYLQFNESGISIEEGKFDGEAPEPTALTADIADSWKTASFNPANNKEYAWTATAGKEGSYFTLNIAGSDTVLEPTYVPSAFDIEDGKTYTVTGWYVGYDTKYNYANIILTGLEEAGEVTPEPDTPVDYNTATAATVSEVLTSKEENKLFKITGVIGEVTNTQYGNGTMYDKTTGESIALYGLSGDKNSLTVSDGKISFNNPKDYETAVAGKFEAGDEITLYGVYLDFNGKPEIQGVFDSVVTEKENISYTATVAENIENGTVTLDKTSGVYGETITITATPADGYRVDSVYVDGNKISPNNGVYTYQMMPGVHEVSAEFVDEDIVETSFTIAAADLGLADYGDGEKTFDINGSEIGFKYSELGDYGSGIQWRLKGDKTSAIWNTTAFDTAIASIELHYNAKQASKTANLNVGFATSEIADNVSTNEVKYTEGEEVEVIPCDVEGATYFRVNHGTASGAFYIDSIVINFVSTTK